MKIRRIRTYELKAAHEFVQTVVNETYGNILNGNAPPIDETDWSPAWVVADGSALVALVLTSNDVVDDLWVASSHRGQGLGSELLVQAEKDIRGRGYMMARLRVVSGNEHAIKFYQSRGWLRMRQYPHGRLPIEMIDFEKEIG